MSANKPDVTEIRNWFWWTWGEDAGSSEGLQPWLETLYKKLETDKVCPRCGEKLWLSDLPEYDYVCSYCSENFYECEVQKAEK